jgi:hypothetical protein
MANERLTAITGVALLLLLAVEGATLLALRQLIDVHVFVGLMLIPPVLLKLASTGYRFVRYYTGNRVYREKGPPPAALRLIAPIVVVTAITMFASGVALLLAGPSSRGSMLPIHKISFIVWVAFTSVHVLGHLPRVPKLVSADLGGRARGAPGRALRWLALGSALGAGVALGAALFAHVHPWQQNLAFGH